MLPKPIVQFLKSIIRDHPKHGGQHFMLKYIYHTVYNGEKSQNRRLGK